MTEPAVGTVLGGKYVVEGILGRGGMGVVVAARHRDLDQRVAIKCLLPHALEMPDVVERFAREARAAVKIQGEHVARVIDVGRFEDGTPYMVMECLQGHDLAEELTRRGTLPVVEAIRYLLEAGEAVAQAHAMRIVHRDLKPSNLFLAQQPGRRPIVKVLDFGISKVVDPGGSALTKTSSVMGTPYYMSPEQLLSSKNVDERSDIWSLGVILYELLSGQPPFGGETAPEIIAKIVQNTPQPPRAARPDLPPGLEAVILRCLRSKPEERFANVAELAAALQPFGDASDRESVAAISRVLGAEAPPSLRNLGVATAPTLSLDAAQGTPPAAAPAVTPVPFPDTMPSAARPPGAATAPNLTVSARDVPRAPRRAWALPVAAGVFAAVVGGVVAFLRAGPAPRASGGAGIVATVAATAASRAPAAALAPLPSAEAAPSASTASAPSASATPPPTPVGTGRPVHTGAPLPAKPVATATAAPQPPPPPPPPAAPTATSKNPLDLQFK